MLAAATAIFLSAALGLFGPVTMLAEAAVIPFGAGSFSTDDLPPSLGSPAAVNTANVGPGITAPFPSHKFYTSLLVPTNQHSQPMAPLPMLMRTQPSGLSIDLPSISVGETSFGGSFAPLFTVAPLNGLATFPNAQLRAYSDLSADISMTVVLDSQGEKGTMRVSIVEGSPFAWFFFSGPSVIDSASGKFVGSPAQFGTVVAANGAVKGLGVSVKDGSGMTKSFGFFIPQGGGGSINLSGGVVRATFDAGAIASGEPRVLVVAALPDPSQSTLIAFSRYARYHVAETRVEWDVSRKESTVDTTYHLGLRDLTGDSVSSSVSPGTLFGLLPHHWKNLRSGATLSGAVFSTVRGTMKIADLNLSPCPTSMQLATETAPSVDPYSETAGRFPFVGCVSFTERLWHPGILPYVPPVSNASVSGFSAALFSSYSNGVSTSSYSADTYFHGKDLARVAQAIPLMQAAGRPDLANRLLSWLKQQHQTYWSYSAGKSSLFWRCDGASGWGTGVGYPDSFGSATELNDHHFHYGYWLQSAASIALHESPALDANSRWSSPLNWGAMAQLVLKDIADHRRDSAYGRNGFPSGTGGRVSAVSSSPSPTHWQAFLFSLPADQSTRWQKLPVPAFPFLRHFNLYRGHSWASGLSEFADQNNQESLSEAVNAWAAMIAWGEATGQEDIVDLGIFLYTHETVAGQQYWFDVDGDNFPPSFSLDYSSMIWATKQDYATWFSNDPQLKRGINLLPITGASNYLVARNPLYAKDFLAKLSAELGGTRRWTAWPDILWSYQALAGDAAGAIALYNQALAASGGSYAVEQGETTVHTYGHLHAHAVLGVPVGGIKVVADTPLFAVYDLVRPPLYTLRTYIATNAKPFPVAVSFSDNLQMKVGAGSTAFVSRPIPVATPASISSPSSGTVNAPAGACLVPPPPPSAAEAGIPPSQVFSDPASMPLAPEQPQPLPQSETFDSEEGIMFTHKTPAYRYPLYFSSDDGLEAATGQRVLQTSTTAGSTTTTSLFPSGSITNAGAPDASQTMVAGDVAAIDVTTGVPPPGSASGAPVVGIGPTPSPTPSAGGGGGSGGIWSQSSTLASIAGAAVALLVLVVAGIVALVITRRNKKRRTRSYSQDIRVNPSAMQADSTAAAAAAGAAGGPGSAKKSKAAARGGLFKLPSVPSSGGSPVDSARRSEKEQQQQQQQQHQRITPTAAAAPTVSGAGGRKKGAAALSVATATPRSATEVVTANALQRPDSTRALISGNRRPSPFQGFGASQSMSADSAYNTESIHPFFPDIDAPDGDDEEHQYRPGDEPRVVRTVSLPRRARQPPPQPHQHQHQQQQQYDVAPTRPPAIPRRPSHPRLQQEQPSAPGAASAVASAAASAFMGARSPPLALASPLSTLSTPAAGDDQHDEEASHGGPVHDDDGDDNQRFYMSPPLSSPGSGYAAPSSSSQPPPPPPQPRVGSARNDNSSSSSSSASSRNSNIHPLGRDIERPPAPVSAPPKR